MGSRRHSGKFSEIVRERGTGRKEPCGNGSPESWALRITKKNRGKDTWGQFLFFVREMTTDSVSVECVLGCGRGPRGKHRYQNWGPTSDLHSGPGQLHS